MIDIPAEKSIAVIIPAFNERLTIIDAVAAFHKAVPNAAVYVIDNNSTDSTGELALNALEEAGCDGRVLFEPMQGKANAVKKAFREIEADIYVMVDADMTYSPDDLPALMKPVLEGVADMTVGDRQMEGDYAKENTRPFHLFGNKLVRGMINLLFKSRLQDIMSGYRVMTRRFVKNYPILCKGFEIETEMTLHALDAGFRIVEVPATYRDRPEGSFSKLNTFEDGFRVIRTIFRIFKDYRPFAFFTSAAAFVFVSGLLAGIPVILEFVKFRYVYKVPSAILASGCMVFALILFSIGMILDTIVGQHKFNYELRLSDWITENMKGGLK